jgi:hypothetical protein
VLTILALLVLGAVVLLRRPEDWHTVYVHAGRWLLEGRDFYDVQATGFTYPPAMALLASPFALVPPLAARLGYLLVTAPALLTFWWTSWCLAGGAGDPGWPVRWTPAAANRDAAARGPYNRREGGIPDWREHAILAVGMLVGFRFVTDVLEHQQTDILIAALVSAAGALVLRGRWLAAAVCCGLGAGLKATPLLWVFYFLVARRWQAAVVLLAVALGINLMPDLISHPPQDGLWLQRWTDRFLMPLASGPQVGQWYTVPVLNQSLAGTLNRLLTLAWPHTQAAYFGVPPEAPVLDRALIPWVIRAAQGIVLLLGLGAIAWPAIRRRETGSIAIAENRPAVPAHGQPMTDRASLPGTHTRSDVPRAGLECGIVLLMMVLLSPASSKPHFLVVLLPAYCLARLALYGRDRLAAVCLALALLSSLLSNRSLLGAGIGAAFQWAGGITWCALTLLIGCIVASLRAPRPR